LKITPGGEIRGPRSDRRPRQELGAGPKLRWHGCVTEKGECPFPWLNEPSHLSRPSSYALDNDGPLAIQLVGIAGVGFLLAIL
jgi:hypothetical protein